MFRLFLTSALLIAALQTAAAAPAGEPALTPKEDYPKFKPQELKLAEGERLTYQIKWGAVDAGQAVLSVKRQEPFGPGGDQVWNVQCETRSNAFLSTFYEVKDDIKTLIDVKEGCSRLFDMTKNEGSFHGSEQVQFDYEKGVANYSRTQKRDEGDKVRTKTIQLPGPVSDPLSCLYYLRGLDLKPGTEQKLTVNTDKKNWVLTLKVIRTEKMYQDKLGNLNALVVEPEAQFQGIFVRKGKMTVWLEEKTHIPLMMKVGVPIGSATATLIKAEGTPLTEKTETKK
jgi:hypothetical protein